jgi:hypothetical protein
MNGRIGILLALPLAVLPFGATQARIVCDGNYQMIRGQPHATPFCQDENLAKVARGYGMRVSGETMRNSFSEKARVCRFIGSDIRVREACQNYRDDNRPPGRSF